MREKKKALIVLVMLLSVSGLIVPAWVEVGGTSASASGASVQKALDYLKQRQKSDGGFAEPGQSSSDQLTAWATIAVKSAGEDPREWRVSGRSPVDYLSARAGGWTKLTDIERGCLAVASAGADPRSFYGRDLVGEIKARMAQDGHIGDMVNEHCWGVIALSAAGEPLPDSSRAWLCARQNTDGGFGFSDDAASDPDDTGAALQALMVAGEDPAGSTVDRAIKYLRFCQASDGGFCWRSTISNTASTSWASQGIAATGEDPGSDSWVKAGNTPVGFLTSMQRADGHISYSKDSDSNPAWMTAEAIPALQKRPYPLNFDPPGKSTSPADDAGNVESTSPADNAGNVESTKPADGSTTQDIGDNGAPVTGKEDGVEKRDNANNPAAKRRATVASQAPQYSADGSSMGKHAKNSGLAVFLIICAGYLVLLYAVYTGLRLILR